MKIYTGRGDKGQTGIRGGEWVDKDDIRIIANGSLDELNAVIGVVRACLPAQHVWHQPLFYIQQSMMTVMSQVATPSMIRDQNLNVLPEDMGNWCENQIDTIAGDMVEEAGFVLPGGNLLSAHLHLARTVARRAETLLWTLHKKDPVPEEITRFINRLSDLLFMMARAEMQREGMLEEKWKSVRCK